MEILEKLRARARAFPQHIVLFEGEEDRTLEAARLIEKEKLAHLTLLGDVNKINSRLQALGITLETSQFLDPASSPKLEEYAEPALPAPAGQGNDARSRRSKPPGSPATMPR